jgi:hypothetical protein
MIKKEEFKETSVGYTLSKNWITVTIIFEEGEWIITIKALGFISIKFPISDLIDLLRKKEKVL